MNGLYQKVADLIRNNIKIKGSECWISYFEKWNDFNGRTSRNNYWTAFAFNFLSSVCLSIAINIISAMLVIIKLGVLSRPLLIISGLWSLFNIVPGISIAVRRMHDTNKSGLMLLLGLIPCFGLIILIVLLVGDSVDDRNQFGNPDRNNINNQVNNAGNDSNNDMIIDMTED